MPPPDAILAEGDEAALMREGLVTAAINGTRKLHKRRLNRSSDEEHQDLPLTPVSMLSPTPEQDIYASIPDQLFSKATLRFLGFSEAGAEQIWNCWVSFPGPEDDHGREIDGGPVTFLSFATAHIRGHGSDTGIDEDEAWLATMRDCGIDTELQSAIVDYEDREIRLTESCKYWLLDTIKMRYRALLEIQQASREREMAMRRQAVRGAGASGSMQSASASASAPSSSYGGPRSVSGTIRASVPWLQDLSTTSEAVRAHAPGYTTLFKGVDVARIRNLFQQPVSEMQDEPGTNMSGLVTNRGGDFNGRGDALYWALDWEIANRYARWTKRRSDFSAVVIVRIRVPNSALESIPAGTKLTVFWPNDEWRELVWMSRAEMRLPSRLAKYNRAILVIGTICGKPNRVVTGLNSPQEITEDMLLKTSQGRPAVQYVFMGNDGQEFLEDHVTREMIKTTDVIWQMEE